MKEIKKIGDFTWGPKRDTVIFKENKDGKFNVKIYKPNFIERILILLKIIKDKRYDGKKLSWQEIDEVGGGDGKQ